jgi:hypothetical protein
MDELSAASGGPIGQFWFTEAVSDQAVCVELQWREGYRRATFHLPSFARELLAQHNLSDLKGQHSIEVVLSYGVFVAMTLGLRLCLCGDRSVWNDAWGALQYLS